MNDNLGITIICVLSVLFMAIKITGILKSFIRYFKLTNHGQRINATVTEIDKQPLTLLSKGGDAPVFEFEPLGGETIRGVPLNCVYSNPSFYEVGDAHTLFYDPDNPSIFIIKKATEFWTLLAAFLAFGGFFVISIWGILTHI